MKEVIYFLFFSGAVAATFGLFFYLNTLLFYFYLSCLFLLVLRRGFKIDFWLTLWAERVMLSIDQHWQTVLAPALNLGVSTRHKFGNPDETASSVVGKNLTETKQKRWQYIETLLSVVLEGGRPHAKPAIEEDETI